MLNSLSIFILGFLSYLVVVIWRLKKGMLLAQQVVFTIFWFYVVVVLSLTFFPIAIQPRLLEVLRQQYHPNNNFIPFHDMYLMATKDTMHDFIRQVGGNMALFFPFGFLSPLLSHSKKFGKALLIGMICSACLELMQLVLDSILSYNYRTCDVDDFILNACGFIVGYIVISVLKRFIKADRFTQSCESKLLT